MLYVFYGTNTNRVADQANKLVASLRTKRPDAQVYTFDGTDYEVAALDELVGARGLFVEKHVVVLKTPFETTESRDLVLERVERFAISDNIFVLTEGKLLAAHKKVLEKHAHKIEEHTTQESKKSEFNTFALGDALGARNRKALWVGCVEARRAGVKPESMCGTLHWAVKGMLAAQRAGSGEEAGQKPYTHNKLKRFAQNFTDQELKELSRSLITVYHDAHRGRYELDIALERWILTV